MCCMTVTIKKEFQCKKHETSAEFTFDGGKAMKAIAETLVLVWMGFPVGACAVYSHRNNITAIKEPVYVR